MQVHTQWHNLNYNHSLINTSTLVWCEKLYTFSLISPEVRLDQAVVGNIPLKSIFHNHLYLIKPQETRQAELRWQWVMSLYLEHCFHISHSTHKVSRVNMRLIRSAVLLSYISHVCLTSVFNFHSVSQVMRLKIDLTTKLWDGETSFLWKWDCKTQNELCIMLLSCLYQLWWY